MQPAPGVEPLDPAIPRALARPEAYPADPDARDARDARDAPDGGGPAGVEVVQTHLSWVFLTRRRVYKLRKSVELGFVDFGARAERNADCLREVALNRRLAPDVYLGVAPVEPAPGGGFRVGAVAEGLGPAGAEHCVVMRRLPDGRDALSLLGAGELGAAHLDAVAAKLARFHAAGSLGRPAPVPRQRWLEALLAPVEENFRHLAGPGLDAVRVQRVADRARARFEALADRFDARRRAGRVVDGHGDVHLQHVWFEDGPGDPILIDCLEFGEALRRVDTASEVSFLAMDLTYRERPALAERFLRAYAAEADDFDLYAVVDWFASYRAAVRAKVAFLATTDAAIGAPQREAAAASARRHLELAESSLAPAPGAALVVVCGAVGTGKSTAAAALADALGGVVISSDRTRKHLAGLAADDRAGRAGAAPQQGIYAEAHTEAVYAGLLERAAPVVASGRAAVLDATHARRSQRAAAARWAEERGVPSLLVELRCDPERTRRRLAARQAAGRDPSDAGPELLDWSLARFEATDDWPEASRHRVRTDEQGWERGLAAIAATLTASWHRTCNPLGREARPDPEGPAPEDADAPLR